MNAADSTFWSGVTAADVAEGGSPEPAEVVTAPQAAGEVRGDAMHAESPSSLPGDVRERLRQRFEQWLDRMLEGEPPPEGLPPELLVESFRAATRPGVERDDCDLYTLFSSLTALSGEIRLQGRTFKQLTDALAPTAETPVRLQRLEIAQTASLQKLNEFVDSQRLAQSRQSMLPEGKEVLTVLFDLYDRLERGLETFDAGVESLRSPVKLSWMQRMLGGEKVLDEMTRAADALREGYELTLGRLEGAFHQWGIERIGEIGDVFDPEWMAAIEVQTLPNADDGTVLEVYRSGYAHQGQVLQTAQVKVARAGRTDEKRLEQD